MESLHASHGGHVLDLEKGPSLAALASAAVADGADALGMAGGDGSLAVVAAAAAAHDLPFVCIPAGTRNHFALGEHHHAGVLLVSNNPYALDRPLAPGTRPALDSGQLGIVVIDAPDDGPLRPRGRAWAARHLEVNAPALVNVGVDGEAVSLNPPLRFTARPAALRVRISARHPGGSQALPAGHGPRLVGG
jgi:diacylglycerol kinase family enzyme